MFILCSSLTARQVWGEIIEMHFCRIPIWKERLALVWCSLWRNFYLISCCLLWDDFPSNSTRDSPQPRDILLFVDDHLVLLSGPIEKDIEPVVIPTAWTEGEDGPNMRIPSRPPSHLVADEEGAQVSPCPAVLEETRPTSESPAACIDQKLKSMGFLNNWPLHRLHQPIDLLQARPFGLLGPLMTPRNKSNNSFTSNMFQDASVDRRHLDRQC